MSRVNKRIEKVYTIVKSCLFHEMLMLIKQDASTLKSE